MGNTRTTCSRTDKMTLRHSLPLLPFFFCSSTKMNASKTLLLGNQKPLSRNHLRAIPWRRFPSSSSSSICFHSPRRSRSFHSHKCSHYLPEPDVESGEDSDTVEKLLEEPGRVRKLMKMERRHDPNEAEKVDRWFPYHNRCLCRGGSEMSLESHEVIEALEDYILDVRKEKMRRVVANRSYSISLVVEGLTDFGNVSAAFRSADALGIQSAHVISGDNKQRYRDNRHVSRGSEKWLDIELWKSPKECFKVLKSRGYRVATALLGPDTVSIYDMDWSLPTAIVVGNEQKGISDESLELSDLNCCIPMNGMVDSFNVSVAAGILMHHAVSDRISKMGSHGDLTSEERQILLAEFYLRHREGTLKIVEEYGNRKLRNFMSKL